MTDAYTTHREPVESCVFCRVIAGTLSASVVYQDDTELAFMDMQPVTEGLLSYNSTSSSKMVLCTVNSGPAKLDKIKNLHATVPAGYVIRP